MGNRKKRDTVQDLLAIALDDANLPEGAEKRCIERVAVETGPFRVIPRPAHLRPSRAAPASLDEAPGQQSGAGESGTNANSE